MPDSDVPMPPDAARIYQKQLEAVQEICAALAAKNDVEELLRETLRVALDTVEADAGSLLLYEPERRRLVFRHVIGKEELIGQEIDPETDLDGRAALVFRTGHARLTNTNQERYNPAFDVVTGYHTQTILTVPMKTLGRVYTRGYRPARNCSQLGRHSHRQRPPCERGGAGRRYTRHRRPWARH